MPAPRDVKVGRPVGEEEMKEWHGDERGNQAEEAFEGHGGQWLDVISRHDLLFDHLEIPISDQAMSKVYVREVETHKLRCGEDLSEQD